MGHQPSTYIGYLIQNLQELRRNASESLSQRDMMQGRPERLKIYMHGILQRTSVALSDAYLSPKAERTKLPEPQYVRRRSLSSMSITNTR